MKKKNGFSIVEIILAVGIFVIFAAGITPLVVQSLEGNRLGEEQTVATQYASEGLEAARSIKNQSFSNLVNSTGTGILQSGGVWTFSGSSNQFGPNNKYTRVLSVSDVARDSNGNIVASGGTNDPLTKKVTSTVSWNATVGRNDSVVLSTYFTNWKASMRKGGMLVYGNGGTTTDAILYKTIDTTGTWSTAQSTADVDTGSTNKALRAARLYSSATRNEKIMISRHYNGVTQFIYGQVYNGGTQTWGNVQLLSSWPANSFLDVQNFDGTYLANGDFMAVYSDNTNTPEFRVWNGTSWGSQISAQNLGGAGNRPNTIVAKARPGTNEIMLATFDQGKITKTQYFNGGAYLQSNWSTPIQQSNTAQDNQSRSVDFAWSPQDNTKGAVVFIKSGNNKAVSISIWTANGSGSGSWSSAGSTATQSQTIETIDVRGRPGASEFDFCNNTTTPNISCYKSDFSATVSNPTNQTIAPTTDAGIQRPFDLSFESISSDPALAVYSDNSSTPKYKKYTASTSTWDLTALSLTTLTGLLQTVRTIPNPINDDIMILLGDGTAPNKLYSQVWDGSNNVTFTSPAGYAFNTHGTNGSADTDYWYDFTWDTF